MAFSDTWVETDPDGDVITVSLLDDSDRLIKRATRERMEGDPADALTGLIVSGSWPLAPKPKQGSGRVHAVAEAGVAALPNEDGRVAITTDSKRLFHLAAAGDAELDYVPSTGTPKTITAVHTFNPTVAGAPFILGANGQNKLVTNLRAETTAGRDNTAGSVTGTLVETTLATISVPAGLMGANGWLRVTGLFEKSGVAGGVTFRVKFGGTQFLFRTYVAADTPDNGVFELFLYNINATNSQRAHGWMGPVSGGTSVAMIPKATGAIDTTAAQDVTFTAELGNVGDTATLHSIIVEVMPT